MATLKKKTIEQLASIGITKATTESEARQILVAFLESEDVMTSDSDELEELIAMAETFNNGENIDHLFKKLEDSEKVQKVEKVEKVEKVNDDVSPKKTREKLPKEQKATEEKDSKKKNVKFDPLNNDKHDKLLDPIRKFFNGKQYNVKVLKQGVTIFLYAKNTMITLFSIKNASIKNDELSGILWNNRFKNEEEFISIIPENHFPDDRFIGKKEGDVLVTIRNISVSEFIKLLTDTDLLKENLKRADILDGKLGKNRAKLEESLKKEVSKKKSSVAKSEDEEIED